MLCNSDEHQFNSHFWSLVLDFVKLKAMEPVPTPQRDLGVYARIFFFPKPGAEKEVNYRSQVSKLTSGKDQVQKRQHKICNGLL